MADLLVAALTLANGTTKSLADFVYDGGVATIGSIGTRVSQSISIVNRSAGAATVKYGGAIAGNTRRAQLKQNEAFTIPAHINFESVIFENTSGLAADLEATIIGDFA